ncbi:RNA polymerase sigma factor [Coraliomargarita parva]|uniref:RNA polymerase sigma factor n=1 Tax=Coraliomargarita parva TaxID=3014050 RepID=UPI0022B59FF5|nr:RNA polymerase sigma factor [Coraliomargarita parva]
MKFPKSTVDADEIDNQRALVELFHALESPLLGFAYQMVKEEQMAQDIVQEAFVRLQVRIAEVEQPKAWLYTTVRRLAIDHLRKLSKVVPFETGNPETTAQDPVDPGMAPNDQADLHERTGLMRVCLERMKPQERMLVELKFIENLSYKEISDRMCMTVGHVGYALHHALKSLEVELNKEGVAG